MNPTGALFQRLVLFGHVLHEHGLAIDSDQIAELTRALEYLQIIDKLDFYHTTRSLLVKRHVDLPTFDGLFEQFWRFPQGDYSAHHSSEVSPQPPVNRGETGTPTSSLASASQKSEELERPVYSAVENLRKKNFSEIFREEAKAIEALIQQLPLHLGQRKTRRWRPMGRQLIDFRRSLRRSLQSGGKVVQWDRLSTKMKPRSVVLLLDISGSMNPFVEMLLTFAQKLIAVSPQNEAFVFATRLTRITHALRSSAPQNILSNIVQDWSGGTRIGEAIRVFNRRWSRRVLHKNAVVLLVSDGWDRGDINLLRAAISKLRRSCHRLIWLNPLLGSAEYEPLTRGMVAAMPFLDDFLPIHNLISLEQLAQHLKGLSPSRPLRRNPMQHTGSFA